MMKYLKFLLPLLALSITVPLSAQTYQVGDIVQNYTFTDYQSGQDVSLYELGSDGGILVLEWFAWWCPFCSNAAENVQAGIVDYYDSRNGNPHGLPVKHIPLNVQGGARPQSDTFIAQYELKNVVEDYSRSFFRLFNLDGGQPLFVVINAEPNSPSADQWEVIFVELTYGSYSDISAKMRPIIDSIMAGIDPPVASIPTTFPDVTDPIENWYESTWFGQFYDVNFPFVFHEDLGYGYVLDGPADSIFFWHSTLGWTYTDPQVFPFFYTHSNGDWFYFFVDEEDPWVYDYSQDAWHLLDLPQ